MALSRLRPASMVSGGQHRCLGVGLLTWHACIYGWAVCDTGPAREWGARICAQMDRSKGNSSG